MVYYLTSKNVITIRELLLEFSAASNTTTPSEFIEQYLDSCSLSEKNEKLSWIAETFLSFKKHESFLRDVVSILPEKVPKDQQDYFMIVFHAITFQLKPYTDSLYKCMFNLNKSLLKLATNFLSNDDKLHCVAQLAGEKFDQNYINENIIQPLSLWQPYMKHMGCKYDDYVIKSEQSKIKPPTVPIHPNVLIRRGKGKPIPIPESYKMIATEKAPSKCANKTKKMLTKSAIDLKLKQAYKKNKQDAVQLLSIAKNARNAGSNLAKKKSDDYLKRLSSLKDQIYDYKGELILKQNHNINLENVVIPIKETKASLSRINKRIAEVEKGELQWFNDLLKSCYSGTTKYKELEALYREEQDKERLFDIERKHLLVQLSHEEAMIAKVKYKEITKQKYDEFMKEKAIWNKEIENWKKKEMHKNGEQIEKLSLLELTILEAKNDIAQKNKEKAEKIKAETALLRAQALKLKNEELERRINMIKQIKIISLIAKQAKVPKIIDLTESSGFGFLCEMSIAELQERLSAMKINIKEELENKRKSIRETHTAEKEKLDETKKYVNTFLMERTELKKESKKLEAEKIANCKLRVSSSKEIDELRKMLEEKRKLRIQMTN